MTSRTEGKTDLARKKNQELKNIINKLRNSKDQELTIQRLIRN